jgi:hypothetical protein
MITGTDARKAARMTSTVAHSGTQLAGAGYAILENVVDPQTDFAAAMCREWDAILQTNCPGPRCRRCAHFSTCRAAVRGALAGAVGRLSFHQPFESLPQKSITPRLYVGQAVFDLLSHARLPDSVEQFPSPAGTPTLHSCMTDQRAGSRCTATVDVVLPSP